MLKQSDLLGTWTLVRAFATLDGKVVDPAPLGEHPKGFIHYLDDQRVAALIAQSGRKPLSASRRESPEPELAQLARTFDAYAGSYTITDERTVVHHVDLNMFENDVGKDYPRTVEFVSGELHLSMPEVTTPEGVRRMSLVWKRID